MAARVAQIIGADMLILFSDVDGLYDKSKDKKIVKEVTSINEKIVSMIDNKKNKFGSGGITTKLDAAKICMNSGTHMFIANGKVSNPIFNMIKNKRPISIFTIIYNNKNLGLVKPTKKFWDETDAELVGKIDNDILIWSLT